MARARWFVVVGLVLAAAAPGMADANVLDLAVHDVKGGARLVIRADEPLTFQSFARGSAELVVDLLDAKANVPGLERTASKLVERVTVGQHQAHGQRLTRVVLALAPGAHGEVTAQGSDVVVSVTTNGTAAITRDAPVKLALNTHERKKSELRSDVLDMPERSLREGTMGRATASEPFFAQAEGSGVRQMGYIGFRNSPKEARIYARLNAEAKFTARKEGDNLIVLEIQNATIPLRNNRNHLDARYFEGPVVMITPSEVEDATPTIRITIETRDGAPPFQTTRDGREIVLTFKK